MSWSPVDGKSSLTTGISISYVPAGISITSWPISPLASWIAARSEHWFPAVRHMPSPALESGASVVVVTWIGGRTGPWAAAFELAMPSRVSARIRPRRSYVSPSERAHTANPSESVDHFDCGACRQSEPGTSPE